MLPSLPSAVVRFLVHKSYQLEWMLARSCSTKYFSVCCLFSHYPAIHTLHRWVSILWDVEMPDVVGILQVTLKQLKNPVRISCCGILTMYSVFIASEVWKVCPVLTHDSSLYSLFCLFILMVSPFSHKHIWMLREEGEVSILCNSIDWCHCFCWEDGIKWWYFSEL